MAKVSKKARRKLVTEMFRAVEAGESYTILKDGAPAAIILPWADWVALQGHWLDFLRPMRTVSAEELSPLEEAIQIAEAEPHEHHRRPRSYQPPGVYAVSQGGPQLIQEDTLEARLRRHRNDPRGAQGSGGQGGSGGTLRSPQWMVEERAALRDGPAGQGGGEGILRATVNPMILQDDQPLTAEREQPIADRRAQVRAEIEAEVETRLPPHTTMPAPLPPVTDPIFEE